MQVPAFIRDCVVFLSCKNQSDEMTLAGTAFFVFDPGLPICCLVTAKHVIEAIRTYGIDKHVYVRGNSIDGCAIIVRSDIEQWVYHPSDPTTDVAILPFTRDDTEHVKLDAKLIDLDNAATKEVIASKGIGLGDEIFITGLFHKHSGTQRNIPIVRIGNIAAMPEEPVKSVYGETEAYLVECRSIGGLSGSPVWVHLLSQALVDRSVAPGVGSFHFLGLMHGHWDITHDEFAVMDRTHPDNAGNQQLNTGIGVVIPVSKIFETLNQEPIKNAAREIGRRNVFVTEL